MENNYFTELNSINVSDKTEKKNGLTYLSWSWAWGEVKKLHPTANYVIYERETEFGPVNYFTDGNTCWVKTGVIINDIEHIEELPVMDFKNKSIPFSFSIIAFACCIADFVLQLFVFLQKEKFLTGTIFMPIPFYSNLIFFIKKKIK